MFDKLKKKLIEAMSSKRVVVVNYNKLEDINNEIHGRVESVGYLTFDICLNNEKTIKIAYCSLNNIQDAETHEKLF